MRGTPYLIMARGRTGYWAVWRESRLCNVHNSLNTLIGASVISTGSPGWSFACHGPGTGWAFSPQDWGKDNIGLHQYVPITGWTAAIIAILPYSYTYARTQELIFTNYPSPVTFYRISYMYWLAVCQLRQVIDK